MHSEEAARKEQPVEAPPAAGPTPNDTASVVATEVSQAYSELELERRTASTQELLRRTETPS
jgi:hypothetical protein